MALPKTHYTALCYCGWRHNGNGNVVLKQVNVHLRQTTKFEMCAVMTITKHQ